MLLTKLSAGRPVLNDVTAATVNVPSDLGVDVKRQKINNGPSPGGNTNSVPG